MKSISFRSLYHVLKSLSDFEVFIMFWSLCQFVEAWLVFEFCIRLILKSFIPFKFKSLSVCEVYIGFWSISVFEVFPCFWSLILYFWNIFLLVWDLSFSLSLSLRSLPVFEVYINFWNPFDRYGPLLIGNILRNLSTALTFYELKWLLIYRSKHGKYWFWHIFTVVSQPWSLLK